MARCSNKTKSGQWCVARGIDQSQHSECRNYKWAAQVTGKGWRVCQGHDTAKQAEDYCKRMNAEKQKEG